jgi:hypothetical protein
MINHVFFFHFDDPDGSQWWSQMPQENIFRNSWEGNRRGWSAMHKGIHNLVTSTRITDTRF